MAPSIALSSLTLTQTEAPRFGLIASGPSGRQFILNTDGSISGTHAGDYLSGASAGRLVLEDTNSPSSVNIAASIVATNGGLGVNEVLCSYGGGLQQVCSGSGMTVTSADSAALTLGLDITTSTSHRGGDTPTITLELTVSYL